MLKVFVSIVMVCAIPAFAQEEPVTAEDKAQAQELFKKIVEAGQAEIVAKAKKHGCKGVVFGHSLMELAESLKRGIDTIDQAKRIAIETGGDDGMGESPRRQDPGFSGDRRAHGALYFVRGHRVFVAAQQETDNGTLAAAGRG